MFAYSESLDAQAVPYGVIDTEPSERSEVQMKVGQQSLLFEMSRLAQGFFPANFPTIPNP